MHMCLVLKECNPFVLVLTWLMPVWLILVRPTNNVRDEGIPCTYSPILTRIILYCRPHCGSRVPCPNMAASGAWSAPVAAILWKTAVRGNNLAVLLLDPAVSAETGKIAEGAEVDGKGVKLGGFQPGCYQGRHWAYLRYWTLYCLLEFLP